MQLITTSAQKTVRLNQKDALEKLLEKVTVAEKSKFTQTKNANIYKSQFKDQSILSVASFDKGNGSTVAMIDHKNIPANHRKKWQSHWRKVLDELFNV